MVPVMLTEDLAEELESVLGHLTLPSPPVGDGKIKVFRFGIPIEKTAVPAAAGKPGAPDAKVNVNAKEERMKKFPYVLVRPLEGNITGEKTDPQKVSMYLLVGVYDGDMDNRGKRHVLNVINDICERFLKDPVLAGKYYADSEMTWVMDDDEEYPYHYGALWMTFNIPVFRREDRYA